MQVKVLCNFFDDLYGLCHRHQIITSGSRNLCYFAKWVAEQAVDEKVDNLLVTISPPTVSLI